MGMINTIKYRIVLSLGVRNKTGRYTPVHTNSFQSFCDAGYGNMGVHIILHNFVCVGNITSASGHDTKEETRNQKLKFHRCCGI